MKWSPCCAMYICTRSILSCPVLVLWVYGPNSPGFITHVKPWPAILGVKQPVCYCAVGMEGNARAARQAPYLHLQNWHQNWQTMGLTVDLCASMQEGLLTSCAVHEFGRQNIHRGLWLPKWLKMVDAEVRSASCKGLTTCHCSFLFLNSYLLSPFCLSQHPQVGYKFSRFTATGFPSPNFNSQFYSLPPPLPPRL